MLTVKTEKKNRFLTVFNNMVESVLCVCVCVRGGREKERGRETETNNSG